MTRKSGNLTFRISLSLVIITAFFTIAVAAIIESGVLQPVTLRKINGKPLYFAAYFNYLAPLQKLIDFSLFVRFYFWKRQKFNS